MEADVDVVIIDRQYLAIEYLDPPIVAFAQHSRQVPGVHDA